MNLVQRASKFIANTIASIALNIRYKHNFSTLLLVFSVVLHLMLLLLIDLQLYIPTTRNM
jgi:hypothetical protein